MFLRDRETKEGYDFRLRPQYQMDCNPKPSMGHSGRKNPEQYPVCLDYGIEFIKDTFSRQIYLNVALKWQLRVFPNLSDAMFGMSYGKHAMSPEVTLAR